MCCAAWLLCWGRPLLAQAELDAPAEHASAEHAPAIWYRASQPCPTDAEFIAKLAGNAVRPRLAHGGDHIDFLVTLVDSGSETVGRLERQTRAGTVAIRELRDPSCERVAEGLALSLGLALEPSQDAALDTARPAVGDSSEPARESVAPAQSAARPIEPAPSKPADSKASPSKPADGKAAPSKPAASDAEPMGRRLALGAAAGVLYGLSPRPMARGQLFLDLDPVLPAVSSAFSARVAAVGAWGSASTRIGSVRQWVLGGSLAGCAWRVGGERFAVRPCLDFELGATGASSRAGERFADSTLWATPGLGLRAVAALPHRLGLEASAGVQIPLRRDEVFAASGSLFRAEIALFYASLAFSFGLPRSPG